MTRTSLILAAVAGALTLCACGDDDGSAGSPASRQDKAFEGALKYAKCMRDHGVDMADPVKDAGGGIKITAEGRPGAKPAEQDPKMQAAQKACERLQDFGGGESIDPATRARMQDAFLTYARCMRKQGIDMPDPQFDGGKVTMRVGRAKGEAVGPGGSDPESPRFKAADETCHPLLAKVEQERSKAAGDK